MCASAIVVIVVVAFCGGCAPMEVGSVNHVATGSIRRSKAEYSSVVTDVNTHVMNTGTTLPNDPYNPTDLQALPYDPHPQTAHRFTGYGGADTGYGANTGYVANQQVQLQASAQGYEQQGHQSAMPGANRHHSAAEPPPPKYEEAIRPAAPGQTQTQGHSIPGSQQQPYGW